MSGPDDLCDDGLTMSPVPEPHEAASFPAAGGPCRCPCGRGRSGRLTAVDELPMGARCTVFEMDDVVAGISAQWNGRDGGSTSGGTDSSRRRPRSQKPCGARSSVRRTSFSGAGGAGSTTRGLSTTTYRSGNALGGLGMPRRSGAASRSCGYVCTPFRPRHLRGLDGPGIRMAPLPAVLQGLHREGLGRYHRPRSRRTGLRRGSDADARERDPQRLRAEHNKARITSLIEEFHYPRLGPGIMWESAGRTWRNTARRSCWPRGSESIQRSGHRAVAAVTRSVRDPSGHHGGRGWS